MAKTRKIIIANGFETLDGCLDRHGIPTSMLEEVMQHPANRPLATLPIILPARTQIAVPEIAPDTQEDINLWS